MADRMDPQLLDFMARLGHDFRTPLTSILGFTQLLGEGAAGPITADQAEFIADIQSSAAHMNALVEQLMDLAKVQGGHISLHAEPFAMDDVVQQVGRMLRPQLEAGALRFGAVVEPGARDVVQDPFRVRQILLNYIGNAVKYTPREGAIHVHVHAPEPEWISIDVEDTGAGIAQADLERLFRDYGQVDRDRARARRGTGMGLALVKAVTEALGGHVAVRSTLGQGSVFTARLPRTLSRRGA